MGAKFGDAKNPLLVSCRSGARVEHAGHDGHRPQHRPQRVHASRGLIDKTGNERFAWDSYRRFVQMYGDVVLGLKPQAKTRDRSVREDPGRAEARQERQARHRPDHRPTCKSWSSASRRRSRSRPARTSPRTPIEQMWQAVGAVFGSWMQRPRHRLPPPVRLSRTSGAPPPTSARWCSATWATTAAPASPSRATRPPARRSSTANTSSTPRARTWSPASARPRRSPSCRRTCRRSTSSSTTSAASSKSTTATCRTSSSPSRRASSGCCRRATASAPASPAVRFAVDMVRGGAYQQGRGPGRSADAAGRPQPTAAADLRPGGQAQGHRRGRLLPRASTPAPARPPGGIKFLADDAEAWVHKHGKEHAPDGRVILVRRETSPEDIRGMQAADGILTAFGGASSHAALVSRQMGKVCIVGCGALQIDYDKGTVTRRRQGAQGRRLASASTASPAR